MADTRESVNTRLFSVKDLCDYIHMGECNAVKWAKSIGAGRRIGRRILFDKQVIDKAIDNAGKTEIKIQENRGDLS